MKAPAKRIKWAPKSWQYDKDVMASWEDGITSTQRMVGFFRERYSLGEEWTDRDIIDNVMWCGYNPLKPQIRSADWRG